MRVAGLEPARQRHTPLKRACLPIPAHSHILYSSEVFLFFVLSPDDYYIISYTKENVNPFFEIFSKKFRFFFDARKYAVYSMILKAKCLTFTCNSVIIVCGYKERNNNV